MSALIDLLPSLCVAHIDVSLLRSNLRLLADRARIPTQCCMPVIKADAYGHGLIASARALASEDVRRFAVNTVAEGVALRQAGIMQDIIVLLGIFTSDDAALAAQHRLIVVAYSHESLARVLAVPEAERPPLALKFNTGMTRLGFAPADVPAVMDCLRNARARPQIVLSHFAMADTPDGENYTRAQATAFDAIAVAMRAVFPDVLTSLCNSAGALAYSEYAGDIVRPGEALYGGNVFDGTDWMAKGAGFAQVMSVSAPVLQVREVPAGQAVSYGCLYSSVRPARLAVLGIGYADGYPRSLSCRGEVCLAGQRVPVRGRVCMSMLLVDVTHIDRVCEGDLAWVTGGPYTNAVSIDALARQWGSIAYEVHCVLGRNTRQYTSA